MGEYNELTDYRESASGVTEALAHYLYDHYETNPGPARDQFSGAEWQEAGKRKREHWWNEAENLIAYAAGLFVEQVKR